MIDDLLRQVSGERIHRDLFHLSKDPLPYRKASYTRPGQTKSTLEETDAYICSQLEAAGCDARQTHHRVQAFRCDETKPVHHWYAKPEQEDPYYDVTNVEGIIPGTDHPEEIIQLISHKDSMSWIDSPGARDNCVGTVANLELARLLASAKPKRTIRVLFCNEEHTPWTSRIAAEAAAEKKENLIAVLNVDSVDGKSDADTVAGKMTHVVTYSTDEGLPLAEYVASRADQFGIDLTPDVVFKEKVNDDDGMFINAGYRRTVMNIGSFPYEDSQYHLPGDVPERVNIENVVQSVKLILAAVVGISESGEEAFETID
jgi:hypothetical protein